MSERASCPPHRRREGGPGWVKCLDCGAGYGWPGILDGTPRLLEPGDMLNPGDVVVLIEFDEAV